MRDFTSPTTTLDLTAVARANPALSRYHVGTFPLDALPQLNISGRPRHVIYNTAASTSRGEHWISIWLSSDMSAEIVDSLGKRPMDSEVLSFLRRHCKHAVYTAVQVQDKASNTCGLYCLSHGSARARGVPLKKWMSQFSNRLPENDARIECEFMRHLAFPDLFLPRVRNWRLEVARACQPAVSRSVAGKQQGCRPPRRT